MTLDDMAAVVFRRKKYLRRVAIIVEAAFRQKKRRTPLLKQGIWQYDKMTPTKIDDTGKIS